MTVGDYKYIIIGGTTKAGTTSLYNYLSDHPQVSASYRKEVNFFLDPEIEASAISRFEDGAENYSENFNYSSTDKLYLEASPGYLYSHGTAGKISETLPRAKVVFLLREPISRLISWYKFGRQIGVVPEISFEEFVELQFDALGGEKENYLEQGLYSKYLQRYYDALESNNINVIFFDDLKANPGDVMRSICSFGEINADYYDSFQFKVANRSVDMKSVKVHQLYIGTRKWLSLKIPRAYFLMRKIWTHFKPIYIKLNSSVEQEIVIPDVTMKRLVGFYSDEKTRLQVLINRDVPWNYS